MKREIFSYSDSNIAGYAWRWHFSLEGNKENYTITCKQKCIEADMGDEPIDIAPVIGLRDGADIFEALNSLVSETGYSLQERDLESVALKIAEVSSELADEFRRAPEIIEARDEISALEAALERQNKLRPYREAIDRYVTKIDDTPLRYPGGGNYGTRRSWTTVFLENYVVEHGCLPSAKHSVRVKGYHGGEHDFSDLVELSSTLKQSD